MVRPIVYPILVLAVCALAAARSADAQPSPIGSDPLTERGISPRLLDVALYPLSQDLAFEMLVEYESTSATGVGSERFRLQFDPLTPYGRDLQIEFEGTPIHRSRHYRSWLESTLGSDYWLRQEDRLHDSASIEQVDSEGEYEVFLFRFDKLRVPSTQRWLLNLQGRAFVRAESLERVEFESGGKIDRNGKIHRDYRAIVTFGEVRQLGGQVVESIDEQYSTVLSGEDVEVHSLARLTRYADPDGADLEWDRSRAFAPVDYDFDADSALKLDLERKLPFYANDVRRMGFELPKTYGVSGILVYQDAEMRIDDIKIHGISTTDDLPFLQPGRNRADTEIYAAQVRGDLWVLPFLNLSVIGGQIDTLNDITLNFTPEFRALYELEKGEPLPETVVIEADGTSTTVGWGLTTGLAYEHLIVTLAYTFARTTTRATRTEIDASVLVGLVGYDFGASGTQALVGIQYLDTDRTVHGQTPLGPGQAPLEFSIDIGMEETMFMAGFNKFLGRSWTMTAFAGFNSTTVNGNVMFGYRW